MNAIELRVKICGLREEEHAAAALEAGADLLGFVFAPSRRQVRPAFVKRLIQRLPRGQAQTVGVFVDSSPAEVNAIAQDCRLDWAQLSGRESPAACQQVQVPAIKAFSATSDLTWKQIAAYRKAARLFLLDAFSPGAHGGTGRPCNWRVAAQLARRFPVLLAGGLTPQNVAAAISTVRPWGVDVSSGVETGGVKDAALIAAFVYQAKQAAAPGL